MEEIFLKAYQITYNRLLFEDPAQARALLNAPISGQSMKRGRNLLTLSAFSGFKSLPTWGIQKGADINAGDKDNATMLRMSVANQLIHMMTFALDQGGRSQPASGGNQR